MVGQITYPTEMEIGSEGLEADCGFRNVLSPRAAGLIPIGRAVSKVLGADYQAHLPSQNLTTLVFSADLITANEINGSINGVAIAPVTFDTSHLITMGLIADEIEAIDGVASATVGGENDRTITVVGEVDQVSIIGTSWAVTSGASQATVAVTNTTADSLYGVALRTQNKMNLYAPAGSDGASPYYQGDCVSMLTRGRVYVLVEDTVTSDDPVYVRYLANGTNTELGRFRADADSATCFEVPHAVWRLGAQAGELAVLEINLPN